MDVEHSREMADQLKLVNKPFKYIEQPGGDHFLSGGAQRHVFYAAMAEFMSIQLCSNVSRGELAETRTMTTGKSDPAISVESGKIIN